MKWTSTSTHYGRVAIVVHWLSAAAILAMLVSGFSLARYSPIQNISLLRVHIFLGGIVAALTAFQIVWRVIVDTKPAPLTAEGGGAQAAARFVHIAFYLIIMVMVIIGMRLFFKFELWSLFGRGMAEVHIKTIPPKMVHAAGAFALTALFILHILGAAYHQLILRDALLARTLPGRARQR